MVFQLPEREYWFPDPLSMPVEDREPDGFYAVGGDLHPLRLLEAYSQGIFPWCDFRIGELHWYCPMQRFVIFPDEVHVSHSMRTLINKGEYRVTMGKDFEGVISHCSQLRIGEQGAWLGPEMVKAYTRLHDMGYAQSVEVWRGEELVGGLYGVVLLNCFFGESMFSLVPSASKLALIALARHMQQHGGVLIDCQLETPHLRSMGGRYIPYEQYLSLLWPQSPQ